MRRNSSLVLALLILSLAGLAAPASAQRFGGRERSPEDMAQGRAHSQLMNEINEAEGRSRAFLVRGETAKAEAEADRALRRLDGQEQDDAMPVHELLAEIYVEQGRYLLALEELKRAFPEYSNVRLKMTKALALVGANRSGEAIPLLSQALKLGNVPVLLLGGREDLPAACVASKTALAATAYLLRGIDDYRTRQMDFEAALRLAPKNPLVALNAARFFRETAKRPDLALKALAGAVGGGEATRVLLRQRPSFYLPRRPSPSEGRASDASHLGDARQALRPRNEAGSGQSVPSPRGEGTDWE